jgi:O-antigen/teichoic acid export membrane protein
MVLARLLAPQDFGLMAMAGAVMAVVTLFADFGLGSALMHFPRPDRCTFSTIYWLNLGVSCCLAAMFGMLAWPLSLAYGQADLQPVLLWLSLVFPAGALGQPFRVMAEKELRFPQLARQEIVSVLLGFLLALAVAISGGGVFALVVATLTTTAASSVQAWFWLSPGLRPTPEFCVDRVRPFVAFGLHRVGSSLWNALCMQVDVLIAGIYARPAEVAFYAVPRELCLRLSNAVINPVVTRIGLPVMTRLQHDPVALRGVYLQTLRMTASLNFPFYALLALFPEQIVAALFGEQWLDSASYLRVLALWGLIRSTGNPSGSLLYAVGLARRSHLWNLALLLVTIPSLWVAASVGGLPALVGAMCVLQCLVYVLAWRFLIRPGCGAGFIEYNAHLAPPFCATVIASVVAFVVTHPLPSPWKMPVGVVCLGTVYLAASRRLNRVWLDAMIELGAPLWKFMRRCGLWRVADIS